MIGYPAGDTAQGGVVTSLPMLRPLAAILVVLLLAAAPAAARAIVRVGGYDFPPFVEITPDAPPAGLTLDLIAALNRAQNQVEFRFVPTSPRRRYADLMNGRFDAMFFEEPEWEWRAKGYPVDFTNVFLTGAEVFIAQAHPGRGQDYFASLKGKSLAATLGYHYAFAGFDADPAHLAAKFDIKLVGNPVSCIDMVLAGRVDVAIVTDALLWAYLHHHPAARGRLLVADTPDQVYNHRILIRRGSAVDVATLNRWLAALTRDGRLDALWRQAGVVR